MPTTMDKFNQGGLTSETINRQFTPEKVLEAVVTMPKRKMFFSNRASVINMPKHHGNTITKEVRYPMLHKDNLISENVDAKFAVLQKGVWYRTNAEGDIIAKYDAKDYLTQNGGDYEAASKSAHDAAQDDLEDGQILKSGAGEILNGKASYAAFSGPIVPLPEEGGVVNGLMGTSKLISSKITFHGVHTKYTVRSVDLDSRVGQVARKIADLSDAVADLKEQQVQNSLLTAGNNNAMMSTTDTAVVAPEELDGNDRLTYDSLEAFALELQRNDVPMDTEIIKGVDLQDTVTVSDCYIAYINREVVPTLTRLEGPGGVIPWKPKEQYAAGTELMEGEVGMITGLPFRFVVVPDLQVRTGFGEIVGANNDDGDGDSADEDSQKVSYKTINTDTGDYNYDVYSMLVVGDDSFSIVGFGANSTKAQHIAPKADVHNDIFGEQGGVSCKWSYSCLVYRPERIKTLNFTLSKTGRD